MTAIVNITGLLFLVALVGVLRPYKFLPAAKRWHYGVAAAVLLIISGTLAGSVIDADNGDTADNESKKVASVDRSSASSTPQEPRYAAEDFYWDDDTLSHQEVLLAAANRIVAENSQCAAINANGVTLSQNRGTRTRPVYFVTCESKEGPPFNVFFERNAASERETFGAVADIDKGSALVACEREARAAAANPQTVDFSKFVDARFRKFPNGRTILRSTFTAKNAFGVEAKFSIECPFDGAKMQSVAVTELR